MILTPDHVFFDGPVYALHVPGQSGSFEMLKDHAAIISLLKAGPVTIINEHQERKNFHVTGGILEGHHNEVSILADAIESKTLERS